MSNSRAAKANPIRRLAVAAGALWHGSAPAFRAALPSYAGAVVLVAVLMGPTGLTPADVGGAAAESVAIRSLLWAAWIAALAPAARWLFVAAELAYLRWLPISRWLHWGIAAGLLVALELPWAILWSAAAPVPAGLAAAIGAAAIHATVAIHPRSRLELGAMIAGLGGLAIVVGVSQVPGPLLLASGGSALAVAVPVAWARANEAGRGPPISIPRSGPIRALAVTFGSSLANGALLGRVVVGAAVAGGLGGLVARANDFSGADLVNTAAVAALVGAVGTATAAGLRLAREAGSLRWVLESAAVSGDRRAAALIIVAVVAGALTGAAIGAMVVVVAGAGAVLAAAAIGAAMAAGAAAFSIAVAVAVPERPRSGVTVFAAEIVVAGGIALAIIEVGAVALVLAAAAVALGAGATAGRAHDVR